VFPISVIAYDISLVFVITVYILASQLDHSDSDCFGCAILSYGIEGRIYATDGMLPLDVLIVPFKGDKCPMLVGKPKLFFLQVSMISLIYMDMIVCCFQFFFFRLGR
jgi:hypothetical protein